MGGFKYPDKERRREVGEKGENVVVG